MVEYYPEGWLIDTAENRAALQSTAALIEACRTGQILEGRAGMRQFAQPARRFGVCQRDYPAR